MKLDVLSRATGMTPSRVPLWVAPLTAAMARYEINTPQRQAHFLAQVGHESGGFLYVRELGGDKYLSKYDTGSLAKRLGNTPEADGDGQKYRGRGLIQVTGLANYRAAAKALGLDLLNHPELLEQLDNAAMSAGWFWKTHGLNELADKGDIVAVTRRINGGTNGLEDRKARYTRAAKALGL